MAAKGKLVLSELFIVARTKWKRARIKMTHPVKKRMILTLKRSGVAGISVNTERPELPRMPGVIFSNLEMWRRRRGCRLRHLVLYYHHDSFDCPNLPSERWSFATRLQE